MTLAVPVQIGELVVHGHLREHDILRLFFLVVALVQGIGVFLGGVSELFVGIVVLVITVCRHGGVVFGLHVDVNVRLDAVVPL